MSPAKWLDGFIVNAGSSGNYEVRDRAPEKCEYNRLNIPPERRYLVIKHFGGYRHGNGAHTEYFGEFATRAEAEAEKTRLEKL